MLTLALRRDSVKVIGLAAQRSNESCVTNSIILFGGACIIAGHISICDNVLLAAGTGVANSIDKPGAYGGFPANRHQIGRWRKNVVRYGQLDDMARKLRKLEKQIKNASGDQ